MKFSLDDLRAFASEIAHDLEEAFGHRTEEASHQARTQEVYDSLCRMLPNEGDEVESLTPSP